MITTDTLFRAAHTGYAFDGTEVTDGELEQIYDLMRHAPTAMNSQPLRITFVRSPAAKRRLLTHVAPGNRPKSESAPVVAILAADTDFHEHMANLAPHLTGVPERFADASARSKMARFNATLQAGYFILAVRAVGLDAGPMGGFDSAGVDEEFFAGSGRTSVLLVNIGHATPEGFRPRQPRLDWTEAVEVL